MKTIKVKFTMSFSLVGCSIDETVSIDVEDDATDTEINETIIEEYTQWIFEQNNGGFYIIE